MATVAHCLYCFECLSAALDRRKPTPLPVVEELWEAYEDEKAGRKPSDAEDAEMTDAEEDAAAGEDEDDNEDENDVIVDGAGKQISLNHHNDARARARGPSGSLAPPSMARRQLPSPSSGSSSSTPSLQSKSSGSSSTATQRTSLASSRTSLSQVDGADAFSSVARAGHARAPDSPMFVTWNILSRSSGQRNLRGCIGTFEKQNLEDGLRTYALTSAFEDTRFSPVSASEVPRLSVSVTLLTDFERCANPMDWELGTHGIRLAFTWQGKRYGATYLPNVAGEQGWTKTETLVSLMRKAGWTGPKESWSRVLEGAGSSIGGALGWGKRADNAEVIRYQGRKVGITYAEWDAWREWAERRRLL